MTISIDNKYIRLVSSRLRNFKQKRNNLYNCSCCFCGDSKKNKHKARMYIFEKQNSLYVKCHNCSVGTNVAGLLKHLDGQLLSQYNFERFKSGKTNNSNVIPEIVQQSTPKFNKVNKKIVFEHAEYLSNLPEDHFCLEYVKNRQIPKNIYDKLLFTSNYKKFIDVVFPKHEKQLLDDARLVIPFYNEYDELIAVSGRALETSDKTLRYVTVRTNDDKNKLIYGMNKIDLTKKVYVCEGQIDSFFIDNCVASSDSNLIMTAKELMLKDVKLDNIILIIDNEPRNKEIVKIIQNAIKMNYHVVIWPNTIQEKDINAMIMSGKTSKDILDIINSNTFKGIQAQLKFNLWKKV